MNDTPHGAKNNMRRSNKKSGVLPSFWCKHCARDLGSQWNWKRHLDDSGRPKCILRRAGGGSRSSSRLSSQRGEHNPQRSQDTGGGGSSGVCVDNAASSKRLKREDHVDDDTDWGSVHSESPRDRRSSGPTVGRSPPSTELRVPQECTDTNAHRTRAPDGAYISSEDSGPEDTDDGDTSHSQDVSETAVAPQTKSKGLLRRSSAKRSAPPSSLEGRPGKDDRHDSGASSGCEDTASSSRASSSRASSSRASSPESALKKPDCTAKLPGADFRIPRSSSSAQPGNGSALQIKPLRRPPPKKMRASPDVSVPSGGGNSRISEICANIVAQYNLSEVDMLDVISELTATLRERLVKGEEGGHGSKRSSSSSSVGTNGMAGGDSRQAMHKYEIGAAQKMLCVLAYAITGGHAQSVYNVGLGKTSSTRENNVFVLAASHYIYYGNRFDPREEDRQIVHGMTSVKSILLSKVRSCCRTAVQRIISAAEERAEDTFADLSDDILHFLEMKSEADVNAGVLEILVEISEEILSTWVTGHRGWSSGAYSKAGLDHVAGEGFASKFAEKVTRPMAILSLEQAQLFHSPGTDGDASTVLERCLGEWHKSTTMCTKKINDEEWIFSLSPAEVKEKRKEWDKSLWGAWDSVFCTDEGAPFKELAQAAPGQVSADLVLVRATGQMEEEPPMQKFPQRRSSAEGVIRPLSSNVDSDNEGWRMRRTLWTS